MVRSQLSTRLPRIPAAAVKRVAILSAGSRGDVYPYAALGRALQARGCAVRLLTFPVFRELVTGLGLEFFPISDPMSALKSSDDWHCWQSSDAHLPRKLRALRSLLRQGREPFIGMLEESLVGCSECDAVVSAITGFAGPHIAEKLGLPFCWAFLQPETPTGLFPHYMSPWSRSLGRVLNRATYSVAARSFQTLFGNALAAWREKSLRLPPSAARIASGWQSPPVLYGFSRHVIAKPPDWEERIHVTGYWFLDSSTWIPSRELASFLAEGPPPIAVCLNSFGGRPDSMDIVVGAIRQTGQRAVIITGHSAPQSGVLFDRVVTVDFVPHGWLFPRVSAVVHHGGAGTSAAALRAKAPSILLPSFFDQPFWANTLCRLGASPVPLSPHRLSVQNLALAIDAVVSKPQYRQQASRLGEKILKEDGAGSAANLFMRYFG